MKLAIVTDTFPPDVNGVAMTLERFAAGLIGRGHAVEVIHPGVSGLNGDDHCGGFTEVCVPGFTVPRPARRQTLRLLTIGGHAAPAPHFRPPSAPRRGFPGK